jgi:hypothetical protein
MSRVLFCLEERQQREKSEEVEKLNQNSQNERQAESPVQLHGYCIHTLQKYRLT